MGDIAAILPACYGLSGRATKERGNYICRTKLGQGKISKTNESPQAIHRRYALLEQLAESGFDKTDRILLTEQNAPYINLGRETYVMTRHIAGRDMNLDKDMPVALESLANFHKAARGLAISAELPKALSLFDAWEKQSTALEQALKQVNRSSRLSDFDMLLLKNASNYTAQISAAVAALKKTDYTMLQADAISQNCICHNNLKEENLPITEEACYITRITEATLDLQLTDLANFIRRYAQRSNREISIEGLMEVYDRINPLPASASAIIYAQLIYPWQFIKIVKQHYSKKRGWTPIAIMSRMNAILEAQSAFDEYVLPSK